jgi:hypothetical protein
MKNFDETRKKLKSLGWKREDRTSQGVERELWVPPWDGVGMSPLSVTYETACKNAGVLRAKGNN